MHEIKPLTEKLFMKFCQCCGYNTISSSPISFEICEICFWQNDAFQNENPNDSGGPNNISLIQAQKNFIQFEACQFEMIVHVRKPNKSEFRSDKFNLFKYSVALSQAQSDSR